MFSPALALRSRELGGGVGCVGRSLARSEQLGLGFGKLAPWPARHRAPAAGARLRRAGCH
ncbi:MAG: hypothetical protein QM756_12970 [Polyangiaceae bacterium]